MASLEQRGNGFRIIFRLGGRKHHVGVNATDRKDADACRVRLEENLRLVERGRLAIPDGADVGLFLLTDGRLDQKVKVERQVRLEEMFDLYRREFTAGAKEAITREMEDILAPARSRRRKHGRGSPLSFAAGAHFKLARVSRIRCVAPPYPHVHGPFHGSARASAFGAPAGIPAPGLPAGLRPRWHRVPNLGMFAEPLPNL